MILHGDCLEVLRTLEPESVDAVVTDPPYGLVFMNKHWDAQVPSVDIWREVMRVLKPGGHLLSFGGTRTYHRMAVAIEDAGFEIRDQIQWIYGSGFPKSLDVSKAIDKAAGAEREVIAVGQTRSQGMTGGNFNGDGDGKAETRKLTKPETDAAKKWRGWGSALKPANEPIVLARKPLAESTVAKNVVRYGTGALNIDQTRILTEGQRPSKDSEWESAQSPSSTNADSVAKPTKHSVPALKESTATNSVEQILNDGDAIGHLDISRADTGCSHGLNQAAPSDGQLKVGNSNTEQSGNNLLDQSQMDISSITSTVTDSTIESKTSSASPEKNTAKNIQDVAISNEPMKHALEYRQPVGRFPSNVILGCDCGDDEGQLPLLHKETCAVGELDRQSGQLRARGNVTAKEGAGAYAATSYEFGQREPGTPGDTGGASRFFARFAYVAKASKRERNAGCEEMPDVACGMMEDDNHPIKTGSGNLRNTMRANHHPTVKPIKLMGYLIRLITPPGGAVLDPFAGSGSTGVAAAKLGFKFIGIEREAEYVEIAKARFANAMNE